MLQRTLRATLVLAAGTALFAGPARAADHHQVALDACAEAIGRELAIVPDQYHQRIDRIRGNSRLVRMRLKVTDQATDDHFVANCRFRPREETVVELAIEGLGEQASRRAIAARN
jgi:hypothetical protein